MTVSNDQNLTDLVTLKSWIGIDSTDNAVDTNLQRLIESASAVFLRLMHRKYFILASRTQSFSGNNHRRVFLEATPVVSVSSLGTSTRTIGLAANYYSEGYQIEEFGVVLFGDLFYTDEVFVIAYTGGFATTSTEALAAEQAVLSMCALWYKRKFHIDEKSKALGAQIMTSYVLDDIPTETRLIANSLKRVGI